MNVTLYGKRNLADVSKLRVFKWGVIPKCKQRGAGRNLKNFCIEGGDNVRTEAVGTAEGRLEEGAGGEPSNAALEAGKVRKCILR